MQLWADGMRWNLEGKLCSRRDGKGLVHNGAAGPHRGWSYVIAGMWLASRCRGFCFAQRVSLLQPLHQRSVDGPSLVRVGSLGLGFCVVVLLDGLRLQWGKSLMVIGVGRRYRGTCQQQHNRCLHAASPGQAYSGGAPITTTHMALG